jgi:adenosine deaminase
MANKNPFEIRFDILAMAKEMLDKQYDMAQENYQTMLKQTKDSAKTMEDMNKYIPNMYQPQEVMAKAEELYKFITKKD